MELLAHPNDTTREAATKAMLMILKIDVGRVETAIV